MFPFGGFISWFARSVVYPDRSIPPGNRFLFRCDRSGFRCDGSILPQNKYGVDSVHSVPSRNPELDQTRPWSSMESATFTKPAMLAPFT